MENVDIFDLAGTWPGYVRIQVSTILGYGKFSLVFKAFAVLFLSVLCVQYQVVSLQPGQVFVRSVVKVFVILNRIRSTLGQIVGPFNGALSFCISAIIARS